MKKIFNNYHLSVYQTPKGFVYAQRRNVNSTAALCFKKNSKTKEYEFLIRYQPLPVIKFKNIKWNESCLFPCCITGSLEKGETPKSNIIKEVLEESGYKISNKNILGCISVTSSTQMNEVVHHFLIDLTNLKNKKPKNDGSYFEAISKNVWVSHKQLLKILNSGKELYLSSLGIAYLLFIKHFKNY